MQFCFGSIAKPSGCCGRKEESREKQPENKTSVLNPDDEFNIYIPSAATGEIGSGTVNIVVDEPTPNESHAEMGFQQSGVVSTDASALSRSPETKCTIHPKKEVVEAPIRTDDQKNRKNIDAGGQYGPSDGVDNNWIIL